MFTVSITALILRHTVPFVLTCAMQYGPLYGCSYLLALLFSVRVRVRVTVWLFILVSSVIFKHD
jgi:hypothetical protein